MVFPFRAFRHFGPHGSTMQDTVIMIGFRVTPPPIFDEFSGIESERQPGRNAIFAVSSPSFFVLQYCAEVYTYPSKYDDIHGKRKPSYQQLFVLADVTSSAGISFGVLGSLWLATCHKGR